MSQRNARARAGLHATIPALPVRDVAAAVAHYRERFGFDAPHATEGFAVLVRDDAVLHLWGATDEDWRSRNDLGDRPICSGAESFLAGTASCGIEVAELNLPQGAGIVPVSGVRARARSRAPGPSASGRECSSTEAMTTGQ
jgi:hypothetical protein